MRVRVTVLAPHGTHDIEIVAAAGTSWAELDAQVRKVAQLAPDEAFRVADRPLRAEDVIGVPPLLTGAVVGAGVPCSLRQTPAAAHLRVAAGPDAGLAVAVEPGARIRIGRALGTDLRLADPDVSRAHAEVIVGWDGATVLDLRSTNGTTVDGRAVDATGAPLPAGACLRLGASVVALGSNDTVTASVRPDGAGHLMLNRPPRLDGPVDAAVVRLPEPARAAERIGFPVLAVLIPLVLAAALVAWTRQPQWAMFAVLSPVMALGQWWSERRRARRRTALESSSYAAALATAQSRRDRALAEETTALHTCAPDPATLLLVSEAHDPRLWRRRPADHDHLWLRLGVGDLPARLRVEGGHPSDDPAAQAVLRDVPITVELRHVGVLGLTASRRLPGRHERTGRVMLDGLARHLVGQLAVHHPPGDVGLVLLTGAHRAASWAWATHLPHLRPDAGGLPPLDVAARVGTDPRQVASRIGELAALIRDRTPMKGAALWTGPYTVVVVDGVERGQPDIDTLLRSGPAVGVLTIWVEPDPLDLPAQCRARAIVTGPTGTGLDLEQAGGSTPTRAVVDATGESWGRRLARALAPLDDGMAAGAATLPDRVGLCALLGLDPPRAAALADRWAEQPRSTHAVLGADANGTFAVDLAHDGPHALVAGTTGAGKSELLQTLVASMAVANRPDELVFVLVDYKGGAAFAACALLPHVVGLVTDLDPHLTQRALSSLEAELRRREVLLARVGAPDLTTYQRRAGAGDPRLARLVLVVDEFATLAEELPDFVGGLVGIAQRGRSLGVHLVLATQRPAGVVSAEIKANTSLRIALRVTDAPESSDIIDSPAAATIPRTRPGRAYVRRGTDSPVEVQVAQVDTGATGPAPPVVRPLPWTALGDPVPATPRSACADDAMETLARALAEAARLAGIQAPPSPWLPPLPERLDRTHLDTPVHGGIDDLVRVTGRPDRTLVAQRVADLPYALADLPHQQRRDVVSLDLQAPSHVLVIGGPGTGRTTTLRTLATAVADLTSVHDVHVHALDGGGGGLSALRALPHTGTVLSPDDVHLVDRLIGRLADEVRRRHALLAAGGYANLAEQRDGAPPEQRLPFLLLLIDRWEAVVSALDGVDAGRLVDALLGLLRDGAGAGLRAVVTGDRSALVGRLGSLMNERLVLRLPDSADAALAGLAPRQLPRHQPSGRAVRASDGVELQVALPTRQDQADSSGSSGTLGAGLGGGPAPAAWGGAAQVAAVRAAGARARDRELARARATDLTGEPARRCPGGPLRLRGLPDIVNRADLARPDTSGARRILLGIGGDDARPVTLDVETAGPAFLVAGPPRTGRSTTLLALGCGLLELGMRLVLVCPRASPLARSVALPEPLLVLYNAPGDEALLERALQKTTGTAQPVAVLVDDVELVGDTPLAAALERHVARLGDRGGALVMAGTTAELAVRFRGPAMSARHAGCGLLLSPDRPLDGDLLGARLPRGLAVAGPPGRGVLVLRGVATPVQVALPAAPP